MAGGLFGELGIGHDFEHLLVVALGVTADHEHDLIKVHGAAGHGDDAAAEIVFGGFDVADGLIATGTESVNDGGLRELAGGLEGFGGRGFFGAVRHLGEDGFVEFGEIFFAGGALGFIDGGFGEELLKVIAEEGLRFGEVFGAFGDAPAVWGRTEGPLGGVPAELRSEVEVELAGGVKMAHGAISFAFVEGFGKGG